MSIFHRTAYLTLSALLAIAPAACGGDDDDDDNNGTPDANNGGTPDAAPAEPDAAPAEPDAAVIEGDQYLLSIEIASAALNAHGIIRNIATVALDGATADIQLQALVAPECDEENGGNPLGDPLTATDVELENDGTFSLTLTNVDIPTTAVAPQKDSGTDTCAVPVMNATLTVEGQALPGGGFCGTVVANTLNMDIPGTFGTRPYEKGDLEDPVTSCPAP